MVHGTFLQLPYPLIHGSVHKLGIQFLQLSTRAVCLCIHVCTSVCEHMCMHLICVISMYTLMAPFPLCWCRWYKYIAYTPLSRLYMKHIHHFTKRPIFSVVSECNATRPSRILEHPMGSARKGFTYEITPQSRRASSLKFRLSLCTGCAMFSHLWSLFLACVSAD